jgi:hypothetical protein
MAVGYRDSLVCAPMRVSSHASSRASFADSQEPPASLRLRYDATARVVATQYAFAGRKAPTNESQAVGE